MLYNDIYNFRFAARLNIMVPGLIFCRIYPLIACF